MQRCGCGMLSRVGAHGGTPKPGEARALLRAIWRHVLQLSAEEAAALQDDAPFAAYGGDSLLAVQALPPYSLWRYSLHVQRVHLLWLCRPSRSRGNTGSFCRRRAVSTSRWLASTPSCKRGCGRPHA